MVNYTLYTEVHDMAKSKKIDKDMGFRLKKARLDQKLTYDELSERSKIMVMFQALKNSVS